jgi:hypothetical protein
MPLWSSHPRVFLDIATTGEAMCPYCGTRYLLAAAAQGATADRLAGAMRPAGDVRHHAR